MTNFPPSQSENNGLACLQEKDLKIYSVGISTGGVAEIRMAKNFPQRSIIATTLDHKGAVFARKHIEEGGMQKQIEVKLEDVAKVLAYSDASFDFVYAR